MPAGFKRWLGFLLFCLIAVPLIIYLAGTALVGPYEGEAGILGLMGHIYGDALTGNPAAWLVLLAPYLLILIWIVSFKLSGLIRR